MHWMVWVAMLGSGLFLAGAIWLAASVMTLLRSLEETEEAVSS